VLGRGDLRAARRLAALILHTSAHVARLPARAGDAADALARGSRWARELLDAVGVRCTRSGSLPRGPALLVANHRSYIDIPVLLAQLPCTFLAKREIASWPLFGRAAAGIHTVFVDRGCARSRAAARVAVVERLRSGLTLAAFPEGTTSRDPGVREFFPGLFEEARRHDLPVCPVAIHYTDPGDAWVDDAPFLPHFLERFRKPGIEVRLAFGPVLRAGPADDLRQSARLWIEATLRKLEPAPARADSATVHALGI
jgi:1-acyl-sn-glycerol-3-phosphate acyltransferase